MAIFKQKLVWIGMILLLAVLTVFGAAMMGSVVGIKPKDVPVALVILDQPASMPGGGTLAVGELMRQKLTTNDGMPIKWTLVGSEEEARAGLQDRRYYGALIVPADLSAGVASLAGPQPKPATVQIIGNDGLNTQASTVVKQGLGQALRMVSAELSKSMLEQIGKRMPQIPTGTVQALLAPIQVHEETVNAAGANNASGNAPGLLTQIMWMGSLVTAMILFLAGSSAIRAGARRWPVIAMQPVVGIIFTGVASGFLVWMAGSWYGMELAHTADTALFLWLAGIMFYMLQSTLLNWIGMPAMAILVLLMFFSMPLLNMAPEFLSETSQTLIYSWTPLRFAAVGMREVMYFGGMGSASSSTVIVAAIGAGFLLLLLASGFKRVKRSREKMESATAGAIATE
ncbi:YhgE/Pip domain-containing protein [Paenibacillus chitinolyticus]|uniref:YhgE/Pip domain-containing protein n=1 Tax=Paenibacillus chitinolyticus TaxID=79263 RepID=UPI0035DE99FD